MLCPISKTTNMLKYESIRSKQCTDGLNIEMPAAEVFGNFLLLK